MSHKISYPIPPTGDFLFPESLENLGGPFVRGQGEINSRRADRGIGCLTSVERKLSWLDDFEHFLFQVLPDGTRKAVRKATQEDIKNFRVPIWIQGEAVPMCCDREMIFVGQLDENDLCTERPEGAKMWWHDAASFYVFTCPICLAVTAVGQQY
jgi:hypothetical protein